MLTAKTTHLYLSGLVNLLFWSIARVWMKLTMPAVTLLSVVHLVQESNLLPSLFAGNCLALDVPYTPFSLAWDGPPQDTLCCSVTSSSTLSSQIYVGSHTEQYTFFPSTAVCIKKKKSHNVGIRNKPQESQKVRLLVKESKKLVYLNVCDES